MYHSVTFTKGNETVNTWENWHLIPSSRPVIAMPKYNEKYVDIPGRDGSLDLSDYLTGKLTYSDRTGTLEFIVVNDYGYWEDRRAEIAAFLDGSRMTMILEDDPTYYYEGRCFMTAWTTGDAYSSITVEYRVRPHKYRVSDGKAVL